MIVLKEKTERVLRLLDTDGAAKAKDLVRRGLAQATIYRAFEELRERGLVTVDEQGLYTLHEKGRAWIEARDGEMEITPELPIPALDHAPSDLHRSFMTISMSMTAARWHGVNDRSYGALVAIGESGGFKSTGAEAVVVLAGGNRSTDIADVSTDAGKGLLIRRDGRGEVIFRSPMLSIPVAVFDEAEKIEDKNVESTIEMVYLAGKPTITIEGKPIDVRCTSILTMNPVTEGATSFVDLTGFHSSRDRRILAAYFPELKIPPEQLDKEEFWLAKLIAEDSKRKEKLPQPRNPGLKAAGRLRVIIDLIVKDPDVAKRVDEHVLNNAARGATAWLDDERAVRLVAYHWGRMKASLGHCHDDWEQRLAMHWAPKAVRKKRRNAKILKRCKPLYMAVKAHLDGDFMKAVQVIERERVAERIEPQAQADMVALVTKVLSELDGGTSRALAVVQREIDLQRQGLSADTAVELEQRRKSLDLNRAEALGALDLRAGLKARGLSKETAETLAEIVQWYGGSTDAPYILELGFEAFLMGYRLERLKDLARHAPRRRA